jgi:hydrogenase maturation protease
VCLGSRYRGDDAVGPEAAERLRAAGARVLDCADDPTRLLDAWEGLDTLVVVDAVSTGARAGTLHRVEARDEPLPRELRLASTHAVGVADALELGRALGRAPARVVVLGLEGERFGMGDEMTPAVAAALDGLVAAVLEELGCQAPQVPDTVPTSDSGCLAPQVPGTLGPPTPPRATAGAWHRGCLAPQVPGTVPRVDPRCLAPEVPGTLPEG